MDPVGEDGRRGGEQRAQGVHRRCGPAAPAPTGAGRGRLEVGQQRGEPSCRGCRAPAGGGAVGCPARRRRRVAEPHPGAVAIGAWLIVAVLVWTRVGERAIVRRRSRPAGCDCWHAGGWSFASVAPTGGCVAGTPAGSPTASPVVARCTPSWPRRARRSWRCSRSGARWTARTGSWPAAAPTWAGSGAHLDGGSSASIGGRALPAHTAPGQVGPEAIRDWATLNPELGLDL